MKQILSLFMFGIRALLFVAFFATLKPTVVIAAWVEWNRLPFPGLDRVEDLHGARLVHTDFRHCHRVFHH